MTERCGSIMLVLGNWGGFLIVEQPGSIDIISQRWSGGLNIIKELGGGKKSHSVCDGLPFRPMCTSSPKRVRWLCTRVSPLIRAVQVGKGKVSSLT